MGFFVEFHLIQNFAPSNLNRDDTGAPKDAIFGGQRRARISSQSFKRAIRLTARQQALLPVGTNSIRTKKLKSLLLERLSKHDSSEAEEKIEAALAAAGLSLKDDGKTEYLLFLGEGEVRRLAELIDEHWDQLAAERAEGGKKTKKAAKASAPAEVVKGVTVLLDGGKAVDVALFGRMLADLPAANRDAACQVAHAISTHRVEREFDYYTAVDDLGDADETGAGMIGQIEFNSATLYRYAVIDAHKLHANLHDDAELAATAALAFTQAAARAIPTGKQNTFAAHNAPAFVGACIRHDGPLNLANAFEKPIWPRRDRALSDLSVEAMTAYEDSLAAVYANPADRWAMLDLTGAWPEGKGERMSSLQALATWVSDQVAAELRG